MTEDYITATLKQALASIFKEAGKNRISPKELTVIIADRLKWIPESDAVLFIQEASKRSLIEKKMGEIYLRFPLDSVFIPKEFNFKRALLHSEVGPLKQITSRIAREKNLSDEDVMKEIMAIKQKLNIVTEAAAVLLAYSYEIEVFDLVEAVEKQIFKYSRESS